MITWQKFVAIAKEETKEMATAHGFEVTSEKCPFFRVAKNDLEVNFYFDAHGRREFDVGIKKINIDKDRFVPSISIGNLLAKTGVNYTETDFLQITSESEARTELRRIVALINKHFVH